MSRHIRAIIVIFICSTIAWSVLGSTIFSRTYSCDSTLRNQVASIWGAPHVQKPPSAYTTKTVLTKEETKEGDKTVIRTVQHYVTRNLPLEGSQVDVNLDLEHRQKGLLWYSTYKVGFNGASTFENTTDEDEGNFTLQVPTAQAIYDDLVFAGDGQKALELFQRTKPALIVLDITMPEMDGLAVCREIRKTSNVPILFLSSPPMRSTASSGWRSAATITGSNRLVRVSWSRACRRS